MLSSSTIRFDGRDYTILRSYQIDVLHGTITIGATTENNLSLSKATRVIASSEADPLERTGYKHHYLIGTFLPSGKPVGAVSRPPYGCCAWGEYENKKCVHQNWRDE